MASVQRPARNGHATEADDPFVAIAAEEADPRPPFRKNIHRIFELERLRNIAVEEADRARDAWGAAVEEHIKREEEYDCRQREAMALPITAGDTAELEGAEAEEDSAGDDLEAHDCAADAEPETEDNSERPPVNGTIVARLASRVIVDAVEAFRRRRDRSREMTNAMVAHYDGKAHGSAESHAAWRDEVQAQPWIRLARQIDRAAEKHLAACVIKATGRTSLEDGPIVLRVGETVVSLEPFDSEDSVDMDADRAVVRVVDLRAATVLEGEGGDR